MSDRQHPRKGPRSRVALVLLWAWVILWLPVLIFAGAIVDWIWRH